MKTKRSRWLRTGLLAAASALTITGARTAHACEWYELCLDSIIPAVGRWFVSAGKGTAVFFYRDVYGGALKFTCDETNIRGIEAACFADHPDAFNRMWGAMNFLDADTRADFTRGMLPNSERYSPSSWVHARVAYFMDGNASEAHAFSPGHGDSDATTGFVAVGHRAPVVIWPSAYTYYPNDVGLAGTIVHEADHTRFGNHSWGDGADLFENGPYGTEIQYLARISKTGNPGASISQADKDFAWAAAVAKLEYQIHDTNAQTRLWNTFLVTQPTSANVFVANSASSWRMVADPSVSSIAVSASGAIYGLRDDGEVYQTSAGGAWSRLGCGSHPVFTTVTTTAQNMVYARGDDGRVYGTSLGFCTIGGMFRRGSVWRAVTTDWVTDIAATNDAIYGIGSDYAVYRTTAGGIWAQVTTPWVSKLAVTPDGTIYGMSSDGAVYQTVANSVWTKVTDGVVSTISVTPDGYIFGVNPDNHSVYMTRPDPGLRAGWQLITGGDVSSISVTPDGWIYGIGTNHGVWTHGLYTQR